MSLYVHRVKKKKRKKSKQYAHDNMDMCPQICKNHYLFICHSHHYIESITCTVKTVAFITKVKHLLVSSFISVTLKLPNCLLFQMMAELFWIGWCRFVRELNWGRVGEASPWCGGPLKIVGRTSECTCVVGCAGGILRVMILCGFISLQPVRWHDMVGCAVIMFEGANVE